MTSPTQPAFNTYTADGATSLFPFSFLLIGNTDLEVTVDGAIQTNELDYTITGTGNTSGGTVSFYTPPANWQPDSFIPLANSATSLYQR